VLPGLYFYGVSEPIYYYRLSYENKLFKVPFQNDDQRAQQALFVVLYHWGFHAWGCYILVALLLGFVAYRWDMPMTFRIAFFPLLGDVVHGLFGDVVDFVSMACTTFGVCTTLGFGVDIILAGIRRVDCGMGATCASNVPMDDGSDRSKAWKVGIIALITLVATTSVVTGLDKGLKTISQITFGLGNLLLFSLVYLDNTWYLLNTYVQSIGHYAQYIVMVGFQTDAFEQLSHEFVPSSNLWDQAGFRDVDNDAATPKTWANKVYTDVSAATGQPMADPREYYGSHNSAWIDWWTIFYFGWWVSWAPFVGIFIATISRGRTIRQVVFGAFLAPIIYSFFFLIVLGALGIKMQRVAELGLGVAPDSVKGMVNCTAMGYEGNAPVSEKAVALANIGYFSLACRSHPDRLFDVLSPYGEGIFMFLGIIALMGVVLYFVTSSDSGSYVDDTLSAGGLMHCPIPQRIYWAVTEGACACALMYSGGTQALKALQAISIISGFPLTIGICFMCASLHRACKYDLGEADIMESTRFITGLFDWTEGFQPNMPVGVPLPNAATRFGSLLLSWVAPFYTLHDMNVKLFSPAKAGLVTATIAAMFVGWIGCMLGELSAPNVSYIGWVCYTCMISAILYVRVKAREAYNVYGYSLEDAFSCLVMWPFVCSQLSLQAKALDPVFDINLDPNAALYAHLRKDFQNHDTLPTQETSAPKPISLLMVSNPANGMVQPGSMMMQPQNPMMGGYSPYPSMQGMASQQGMPPRMGGPVMMPTGAYPPGGQFNGYA